MRYRRVGLVVLAACMALVTSTAGAVVTRTPNGHRLSLMFRPGTRAGRPSSSTTGGVLINHGGPALTAEKPYLIFWTPSHASKLSGSEALLTRYLTDVAAGSAAHSATNVYSVLAQYGAPYYQQVSSAQAVIDSDPYPTNQSGCSLAPGMTACVTDASLQTEIGRLIDRGAVGGPTAPGTGTTPVYIVVTPVNTNVCMSATSCVNNSFCAYHGTFPHSGSVVYASVPYSVFASSPKGCQTDQYSIYETPVGSSGDQAYNVADDLSHELSEMISDPLLNAWYSKGGGLEVGDLCEAYGARANTGKGLSPLAYAPAFGNAAAGTLYDQVINGNQYYNQTEFSNSANKCLPGTTPLP
jgi:hypothetical protein